MSHLNFYRKYRPSCFNEVVGQETIVTILKNTIMQNKIHHAYLFAGMQGVGKTSTARILARTINCLNNKLGEMCDECEVCQKNKDFLSDIFEIDGASNNGVEQIRNLKEQVIIAPTSSRYKIFIVDEVHMLSKSAFNAFLKLLEEPPRHVIFILATTEIIKIPKTILSRCQLFNFAAIPSKLLVLLLTKIAKKELLSFDDQAIQTIAHYSSGGVRDALNILEQVAFLNIGHHITSQDVTTYFGFVDRPTQILFLNWLFNLEHKKVFRMITTFNKANINFLHLTTQILEILKDYLLVRINKDVLLEKKVNSPTIPSLNFFHIDQLQFIIDLIFNTLPKFRYQLKSQLIFEIMCLHLLAFLQKQNHLLKATNKKNGSSSTFVASGLNNKLNKVNVDLLFAVLKTKKPAIFNNIKTLWPALEQYLVQPRFTYLVSLLQQCHLVTCSVDAVLLKTPNDIVRNQINNLYNDKLLKELSQTWLNQAYIFYALTQEELYALKLNYLKKTS